MEKRKVIEDIIVSYAHLPPFYLVSDPHTQSLGLLTQMRSHTNFIQESLFARPSPFGAHDSRFDLHETLNFEVENLFSPGLEMSHAHVIPLLDRHSPDSSFKTKSEEIHFVIVLIWSVVMSFYYHDSVLGHLWHVFKRHCIPHVLFLVHLYPNWVKGLNFICAEWIIGIRPDSWVNASTTSGLLIDLLVLKCLLRSLGTEWCESALPFYIWTIIKLTMIGKWKFRRKIRPAPPTFEKCVKVSELFLLSEITIAWFVC